MFIKEELQELLRKGIYSVTFTKVNGDLRVMSCTLDPTVVPPAPEPKELAEGQTPKVKKPNDTVVSVWDINAVGWRSFKLDNVISVEPQVVKIGEDKWQATVQQDPDQEELILPLPPELLEKMGWKENDTLNWEPAGDGTWTLTKISNSNA